MARLALPVLALSSLAYDPGQAFMMDTTSLRVLLYLLACSVVTGPGNLFQTL